MRPSTQSVLLVATLTLAACKGNCPDGDCDTGDGDTAWVDLCGNGEFDPGEECDAGLDEGWGNCQADCSLVEDMFWPVGETFLSYPVIDARGVTVAGAPLGDGAWGTSTTDRNIDGMVKFEFNVATEIWELFPLETFVEALPRDVPAPGALGTVQLHEIREIVFYTYKTAPTNNNFYLTLYTKQDGVDDYGDYYGQALIAHPHLARNNEEPLGEWVKWSTRAGDNQLVFADKPILGTSSGTNLPGLMELTYSESFNWHAVDDSYPDLEVPYRSETLLYVSIQTSSGTATTEFEGLVDALQIFLRDGRSLTLDFEPDSEFSE